MEMAICNASSNPLNVRTTTTGAYFATGHYPSLFMHTTGD